VLVLFVIMSGGPFVVLKFNVYVPAEMK